MTRGSIARKLTLMNMLVSGVALLLACAGFFAYDQITFRNNLVRTLSAQAQIIGANSVSAILFNDPQAATSTLAGLKGSHNISSAGIFTHSGRLLAEFKRQNEEEILTLPQLRPGEVEGYWFRTKHVILVREISSEGKPVGYVYLRADLTEIDERLKQYSLIAFAVLLISLFAAILVSAGFRKSVAQPIMQLAATAKSVSRNKDYTTQVTPVGMGNDEVTDLVDSFNEMLRELHKSHDELEQRVAERTRELLAANRELEAFSYSVSHDLRGPLDAVNGFSYVLLTQYGSRLDAQTKELIENIRSSGQRMGELMEALLKLSRVTSMAMRMERVDLSEIAGSIMQDLIRTAPDRNVKFITRPGIVAHGDPQLMQVLMENLLRNAWKYTSHHNDARIEFGALQEKGNTTYFVKDDGSGFDPQAADRLFQPFQRLHPRSQFAGNGVGLATVRRIVSRHGGEVWAQGAVEKGATFFFTVKAPRSSAATYADPATSGARS